MGRIICAGLGPGDPDLISVRSDRAIRGGAHIAYFRKAGRQGQARAIVQGMLRSDAVEHAMEYPVTTEIPFDSPDYNRLLADFYDDWAARLRPWCRLAKMLWFYVKVTPSSMVRSCIFTPACKAAPRLR